MKAFRAWHLSLIFVPLIGWFLLLAFLLDARNERPSCEPLEPDSRPASKLRRLGAAAIDCTPLLFLALWLPPALAWAIGALYLLFRDAGERPFGAGKRLLGLRVLSSEGMLTYSESFARNLPLVFPYLGVLVETGLLLGGYRKLGDRLGPSSVVLSLPGD